MNFNDTLCITKLLHSKFLALYIHAHVLDKFIKPVLKSTLLLSNGNLSHTVPSSSIAAANKEVSAVLLAMTEYPTQSVCQLPSMELTLMVSPFCKNMEQIVDVL